MFRRLGVGFRASRLTISGLRFWNFSGVLFVGLAFILCAEGLMSQARCISQGDNGEAVLGTTRSFAKQSHNPRPKHFADRCNPCVKHLSICVYIYIYIPY